MNLLSGRISGVPRQTFMAFPVPEHLPRAPKSKERDISSSILYKIDETKTFDATEASGWVAELDDAVRTTKVMSSSTYGVPR